MRGAGPYGLLLWCNSKATGRRLGSLGRLLRKEDGSTSNGTRCALRRGARTADNSAFTGLRLCRTAVCDRQCCGERGPCRFTSYSNPVHASRPPAQRPRRADGHDGSAELPGSLANPVNPFAAGRRGITAFPPVPEDLGRNPRHGLFEKPTPASRPNWPNSAARPYRSIASALEIRRQTGRPRSFLSVRAHLCRFTAERQRDLGHE